MNDEIEISKEEEERILRENEDLLRKLMGEGEPEHRQRRTRKQAKEAGAITDANMPQNLALPTMSEYQNALSLLDDNPVAHLQRISQDMANNLRYENCVLYFDGMPTATAAMLVDRDKSRDLSKLDLITLRGLYSIILADVFKSLDPLNPDAWIAKIRDPQFLTHNVSLYLPDFLKMQGYKPNGSSDGITFARNIIMSYQTVLGIMGGTKNPSIYPVMLYTGYDADSNIVTFTSPYMNVLIMRMLYQSVQRDRQGKPKLTTSGKPFMLPTHSYLVKSSIMKEKNKRAVEIVCIIVTLIEQAGDNIPHISAQTIIDRVPDLKDALETATKPSNKNLILKRAFSKAWELLKTQTGLEKAYRNIVLPDPKDPKNIPTGRTLDMVFEFPHDGKIKKAKNNNIL